MSHLSGISDRSVTIYCGHNFCRGCITQRCETWEELDSDPLCCPSCRARIQKGALLHNYQQANIVEKIRQLDFKPGKEKLCERHGKALDLFCGEDGEAVCVVCERSGASPGRGCPEIQGRNTLDPG
ncbi:unnamed protein product [Eretmochelys imbricata]